MSSRPAILHRLSIRFITRAGYGAMILLLVFTAIEAFRIQASFSQQSAGIYRHYVEQQETLFQLRQNIWRGSVYARDFFLSPDPNRASILRSQLQVLRDESMAAVEKLGALSVPEQQQGEVKEEIHGFWDTVAQIADSMEGATSAEAYEFTQREIVPRRSSAGAALRELTRVSQQNMERSQFDFSGSRQAAARRVVVMLGISVVLGLLVAGFIMWHTENLEKERSLHLEEVEQARRELGQLSARLLEVQEEERSHLSRELHDEIGQILTALRIEISRSQAVIEEPATEVRERLGRARELAERAVHTVRNISLLLRPSALDDLGLVPALHWQVQDFSQRSGIECQFIEEGVQDILPDAIKTCVYRVVQEALHNCEKHAKATMIRVEVRQTTGLLALDVADNGQGADLGTRRLPWRLGGSGILGMRERVAIVGGTLGFESSPGAGLRLWVRIPLSSGFPPASPITAHTGIKA